MTDRIPMSKTFYASGALTGLDQRVIEQTPWHNFPIRIFSVEQQMIQGYSKITYMSVCNNNPVCLDVMGGLGGTESRSRFNYPAGISLPFPAFNSTPDAFNPHVDLHLGGIPGTPSNPNYFQIFATYYYVAEEGYEEEAMWALRNQDASVRALGKVTDNSIFKPMNKFELAQSITERARAMCKTAQVEIGDFANRSTWKITSDCGLAKNIINGFNGYLDHDRL